MSLDSVASFGGFNKSTVQLPTIFCFGASFNQIFQYSGIHYDVSHTNGDASTKSTFYFFISRGLIQKGNLEKINFKNEVCVRARGRACVLKLKNPPTLVLVTILYIVPHTSRVVNHMITNIIPTCTVMTGVFITPFTLPTGVEPV